LWVYKG